MAFLTKSLPRRTVLRGFGATMALPFLDAMLPPFSLCAKTVAKPVHRFQTFYVPNGMAMEYWSPKGEGSDFELTPILEPLAPFRDQMLVLSGIKANWNYIHAGASGSFLTGTTHGGRNEVEIIADVSMDQLLARRFAKETQVASLELSMDLPANAGACTGNLSCAYTHTLSWRSPTQPLPMEWNPRAVFEKLFGDSDSTERQRAGSEIAAAQEHSGFGDRKAGGPQAAARTAGSGEGQRIHRCGSRRRTPHPEGGGAERHRTAVDGAAPGRAAGLRRSPGHDAGFAGAGVSVRSDARHLVHAQQGAERAPLPSNWRARGASSAVAPQQCSRVDRAHVQDQPLSRAAFLAVSGEAPRDARRRRLAARPHDDPVRLGHFQQHPAFRRQPAVAAGGRRSGTAQGRPASYSIPTSPRWQTCW